MEINLPTDKEVFIRNGIESGRFSSFEDAVLEALGRLQEREEKLAWLRAKLQVGIDQIERGEGILIENEHQMKAFIEGIKKRGRERLAREKL